MFTVTDDLSPVKVQEISRMISYLAHRQEQRGQYLVVSCPWDAALWDMDRMINLYDTWSRPAERNRLHDQCFNCKIVTDALCQQCEHRYCCDKCQKCYICNWKAKGLPVSEQDSSTPYFQCLEKVESQWNQFVPQTGLHATWHTVRIDVSPFDLFHRTQVKHYGYFSNLPRDTFLPLKQGTSKLHAHWKWLSGNQLEQPS